MAETADSYILACGCLVTPEQPLPRVRREPVTLSDGSVVLIPRCVHSFG